MRSLFIAIHPEHASEPRLQRRVLKLGGSRCLPRAETGSGSHGLKNKGPIREDRPFRRLHLANKLASSVAFRQRKEIVLPLAVSVCPEIWSFVAIAPNDVDVHFLSG